MHVCIALWQDKIVLYFGTTTPLSAWEYMYSEILLSQLPKEINVRWPKLEIRKFKMM